MNITEEIEHLTKEISIKESHAEIAWRYVVQAEVEYSKQRSDWVKISNPIEKLKIELSILNKLEKELTEDEKELTK